MIKRLTDVLNPKTLNISLSDIAKGIDMPVEKLYFPQGNWQWANIFLVVVEGAGGRFCSYRVLRCWIDAVVELLTSCMDWQTLAELIRVTEWELEHYNYPKSHKKCLQQVLVREKARCEQLKAQASESMKVWQWAQGWERVLKSCPDQASLDMAVQLFKIQTGQFAAYTDAIAWVADIGRQHRASFN